MLVVVLATLFLCGGAFADYKPGTYTGKAIGKKSKNQSGLIEVEVTVSTDKIENIKIITYGQSIGHRKYGAFVSQAEKAIPAAILAKQSVDVDVVARATISSGALMLAVADALHQATVSYKPGTYKGTATGRSDKTHTGTITVEVTVSENKIEDIKVLEYEQSVDDRRYSKFVTNAKNNIPAEILARQSFNVDSVARATLASNGLKLAVARALAQAR